MPNCYTERAIQAPCGEWIVLLASVSVAQLAITNTKDDRWDSYETITYTSHDKPWSHEPVDNTRASTPSNLGLISQRKSFGCLDVPKSNFQTNSVRRKRSTDDVRALVVNLASSGPRGVILNAWRIDEHIMNSALSAKWRPGQILFVAISLSNDSYKSCTLAPPSESENPSVRIMFVIQSQLSFTHITLWKETLRVRVYRGVARVAPAYRWARQDWYL